MTDCVAFMCHHNSFLIYESLVDANAKRWNFVTHVSVLFSMACSLILGVTGYSTFTGHTQGQSVSHSVAPPPCNYFSPTLSSKIS